VLTRTKANIFRRLSILFRPHEKRSQVVEPVSAYGGAAGYRPRVQSVYYMRVYRHIWQASQIYMGEAAMGCNKKALQDLI